MSWAVNSFSRTVWSSATVTARFTCGADVNRSGVDDKGRDADVKGYDADVKGYDADVKGYVADVRARVRALVAFAWALFVRMLLVWTKGTPEGVVYRAQGPSYWAAGRTGLRASLRHRLGTTPSTLDQPYPIPVRL
eukprot:6020620-Pyramimonas_sp.AAC.1